MPTVAHQVIDALARAGTTHVFGVVGTTTLPFLDALHDRADVQYVTVRHEQVGASAADGYARMTRRPGVVLVQGGSGVTNLLLSVCIAWKDCVPLLVVSGRLTTSRVPAKVHVATREIAKRCSTPRKWGSMSWSESTASSS